MVYTAIENFKGFASGKPPLMVFMICLGFFAVILLSLSYYVKHEELTNSDISQDWNVFLESFSDLEFCIYNGSVVNHNTTGTLPSTTPVPGTMTTLMDQDLLSFYRNYSVQMMLTITPTKQFVSIPHNITLLTGTVTGHQMGLEDELAEEVINVSVELPIDWNGTRCTDLTGCQPVDIITCVHFYAQEDMFPASSSPHTCEGLNGTGIEWHGDLRAYKPDPYTCKSRPRMKSHHKFNPALSVWLTLHDKSIINQHLMHTSYFLFVMVIMLFCYAFLRTHKTKYTPAPTVDQMNS